MAAGSPVEGASLDVGRMRVEHRVMPIVILVALAIFISYIDRGNLSTAATLVSTELHISPSKLGFLLTAFFITYVPMQPLIGWLADRFSASRVLVAGFVVWSIATTLSGFAQGFVALFACRLLLGVGESVSFPTLSKLFADNVPESRRGIANAITQAGLAFGPAFGIFIGASLIDRFGWRPFFIGTGLSTLLWIVAWYAFAQRHVLEVKMHEMADAPPLARILQEPSLWGASLGHFCSNFVLYFSLTWVPFYLVHQRHWSLIEMGRIGAAQMLIAGITVIAVGAISDRLIRNGASITVVRKSVMAFGGCALAACLLGTGYSDGLSSAIWLMCAGFGSGFLGANTYVIAQTIAGGAACGRWVGIQNCVGNIAGLIAPGLTGILVERTGNFTIPFTIAAAMALASSFAFVFLTRPMTPIDWNSTGASRPRGLTSAPH